jgi:hypothetical protein
MADMTGRKPRTAHSHVSSGPYISGALYGVQVRGHKPYDAGEARSLLGS